jgi:hypothetical protein
MVDRKRYGSTIAEQAAIENGSCALLAEQWSDATLN